MKPQILAALPSSVILRYVVDGEVVERFMGFHDITAGRSADNLFQFMVEHFGNKYDFQRKLIAQTYDGAAVMAGELNGLQAKIKAVAPMAFFTHCHAHNLNLVLSKACNAIKDSRIFFSNITGFAAFFSKSTKRTNILNEICGNRVPTNVQTRNFTSRAVGTVSANRTNLLEVFEYIIGDDSFKNDTTSIREAVGLKQLLLDPKFNFLLKLFSLIFERTDAVFSILQNRLTDINYAKERLRSLLETLKEFRINDCYFNNCFATIEQDLDFNAVPALKKGEQP